MAILLASVAVVLVSLIGSFVFCLNQGQLNRYMPTLIAVAVGVLLGDAFLHLIPDAIAMTPTSGSSVAPWVLVGILSFAFIERYLQWRHDHAPIVVKEEEEQIETFANMNLVGDSAHNFVDGILIASSFIADPTLGLATTFAIILHEIPQEISDIAILIQGGYSKQKAVLLNFLCATTCIPGALITVYFAQIMELNLSAMLAFTAGGFIYIATSDLMPLLRSDECSASILTQFTSTMVGIASMQAILWWESISFF